MIVLITGASHTGKAMLWVFEENQRARAFYETKGFAATEKTKPALGTTEVCYLKNL